MSGEPTPTPTNEASFDWRQKGVWVVCSPTGTPLRQTLSDTPYGARDEFMRGENLRGKGYTLRGYTETTRVPL